jgi:uncharacterized membrane protein YccC
MTRPSSTSDVAAARPAGGLAPGPVLSREFKAAFKLALSVVLVFGIAMKMNWDRPYWGALAVLMCSFTASGDSLNKGLLRISGTLVAVIFTLALVGLAAQDRWLFLGLLTFWLLVCGYFQTGGTRGYFWTCAGFTAGILALSGGLEPAVSFHAVMLRAQETVLGVVVFSLVSFLLWPVSSRDAFEKAVGDVLDAEARATDYLTRLMAGDLEDGTTDKIRAGAAPVLARLPAMLDGAAADSAEVRRKGRSWRRVIRALHDIREAMERWHASLSDVRDLDLAALLPGRAEFAAEIRWRLRAARATLQGQAPGRSPAAADPGLDHDRLDMLSLFDRAALVSCTDQMRRLDRLSASLLSDTETAQDAAKDAEPALVSAPSKSAPVFDPDRFLYAMRVFFAVWMAILLGIYVPGLPGTAMIVILTGSISLTIAMMPQLSPLIVQAPVVKGMFFAAFLYMTVLPHLSGFMQLGFVLFLAVFGAAYRFPAATAPLDRVVWLAMLVVGLSLNNQQTYSFLFTADLLLPLVFVIWLVAVSGYFPVSIQPQDRFRAQLKRFFRSCSFLVGDSQWSRQLPASPLMRLKERFHISEVDAIPSKMLLFCNGVQARIGLETEPSAQSLVGTLQGLRRRLLEVHAARAEIRPFSERLPDALREELGSWRVVLHDLFERLSADPRALKGADLAGRLDARVRHLEAGVENLLNDSSGAALEGDDALRLYRLLAALRDMSQSLVAFEEQTEAFAWERLRESRF